MPGSIYFKDKAHQTPRRAANLIKEVREKATLRGINLPKTINHGGMYGSGWWICYTTNAMRDLILEVGKRKRLSVERIFP